MSKVLTCPLFRLTIKTESMEKFDKNHYLCNHKEYLIISNNGNLKNLFIRRGKQSLA